MSKNIQNLVVLIEPKDVAYRTTLKGAFMCLNRFCIDEDAAIELSGVHYLENPEVGRNLKGKGNFNS